MLRFHCLTLRVQVAHAQAARAPSKLNSVATRCLMVGHGGISQWKHPPEPMATAPWPGPCEHNRANSMTKFEMNNRAMPRKSCPRAKKNTGDCTPLLACTAARHKRELCFCKMPTELNKSDAQLKHTNLNNGPAGLHTQLATFRPLLDTTSLVCNMRRNKHQRNNPNEENNEATSTAINANMKYIQWVLVQNPMDVAQCSNPWTIANLR